MGAENADGHGEIEARAFLLNVCGSEVDGDVRGRDVEAGIFYSGAHAVAALAHGGVGQADGVELFVVGFDPGEIDFDIDDVRIDAVHSSAESLEKHRVI